MTKRVWVDSWQMQCCGDRFGVGSTVAWTIEENVDRDFFAPFLGPAEAGRITDREEHHGDIPEGTPKTAGVVASIGAVFCRYAPPDGRGPRSPVAGSGVILARSSVDGWEPDDEDGLMFVGYLVDLAVAGG